MCAFFHSRLSLFSVLNEARSCLGVIYGKRRELHGLPSSWRQFHVIPPTHEETFPTQPPFWASSRLKSTSRHSWGT